MQYSWGGRPVCGDGDTGGGNWMSDARVILLLLMMKLMLLVLGAIAVVIMIEKDYC